MSALLIITDRRNHAADSAQPLSRFKTSTATGPLRQHLSKLHLEEWIEGCDQGGIKITAQEAQEHVEAYRKERGQNTAASDAFFSGERRKYSSEAFVDALAAFVVADDQVIFPAFHYFTSAMG